MKTLTFTCAALLTALPSFAFAQSSMNNNSMSNDSMSKSTAMPGTTGGVTKPSSPKAETPAVGTYEGRSSNSSSQQANPAKDTDGLHPNGPALNNTGKP
jgi:hypothetical protein